MYSTTLTGRSFFAAMRSCRRALGPDEPFYVCGWERSAFESCCPIARTLLETAPLSASITRAGLVAIGRWVAIISDVLERSGADPEAAVRDAHFAISALEGIDDLGFAVAVDVAQADAGAVVHAEAREVQPPVLDDLQGAELSTVRERDTNGEPRAVPMGVYSL